MVLVLVILSVSFLVIWVDLFPLLVNFKVTKPGAVTFVLRLLASVGLSFSGSHDPGEIACEIACNLMMLLFAVMLFADMRYAPIGCGEMRQPARAHKCMHLAPVDGSSVVFFSSLQSHSSLFSPSRNCFF